LFFRLVLECAINKIEENWKVLEMNGIHQVPFCADNVNILGENMHTIKKSTRAALEANSKCRGNEVL
jgi:hypothetical protein